MAIQFSRLISKQSDVTGVVATIPTTDDHSDGSWLDTDIYIGELFLNTADNVLQTRTDSGILNLSSGGSGATTFLELTDTPASYSGQTLKGVRVKEDETGLEFYDIDDTDYTLISTITVATSRDLVLTDRNKNIENSADVTLTIPLNSETAFPIGTQIFFFKKAESMTIGFDAGVILNSEDDLTELNKEFSGASLLKTDTDEWNLVGNLI